MPKIKDKRREEFCQQYIIDFNGTNAARTAGFGSKSATAKGSQVLAEPAVQQRIGELLKLRSRRMRLTQGRVLEEMAILGFSDFKDYAQLKKSGKLEFRAFSEIRDGKTRAIESMKETDGPSGRSISMKLHGKVRPLELLGKHLGMFVDTHNVNLTGNIQVISAVPRPKNKKEEKDGQVEETK